jgi:hypothetical protein
MAAPKSGCLVGFLLAFGVLLLLPGACVALVVIKSGSDFPKTFAAWVQALPFLLFIFGLFVAGILMIRSAFRG